MPEARRSASMPGVGLPLCGITARKEKHYREDKRKAERPGIIEIGERCRRRDSRKRSGQQRLRTVGDETLHHARRRVEQRRALARVDAEAPRDVARETSHGDYGHGVVGRAEVHQPHEQRDDGLGAAQPRDAGRQHLKDIADAAAMLDHPEHARGKQCDDDELAHPLDALAHVARHGDHVGAVRYPHRHGASDAGRQHKGHVHSRHSRGYHHQIGQHQPAARMLRLRQLRAPVGEQHIAAQGGYGRRKGKPEVHLEFILHPAPLRPGGRYRGVGDKRQVVAEKSAAQHRRHEEGHVGA